MLNWRELPFVRLLLPFIFGILTATFLNVKVTGLLFLLLFVLLGLLVLHQNKSFQYRWLFGFILSVFFFLLAYQFTYQHRTLNHQTHFEKALAAKNMFVGKVLDVPNNDNWTKLTLELHQIKRHENTPINCTGKLQVYIEVNEHSRAIKYGDILAMNTVIRKVEPNKNPAALDYQQVLSFKNIHYQSFVYSSQWKKIDEGRGNIILSHAFNLRQRFIKVLEKHLKTDDELAVGAALILGYKEILNEKIRLAYAGTGAMHVLAVSGLHVSFIYLGLLFLLGFVKTKNKYWKLIKTLLLLIGIWFFALLTGASPSVLRAATMFSFIIVGSSLDRYTNIYNTLAASAFFLLLINPYLIFDIGFQLSYLAVLGIVYFYPKIYTAWIIDNKIGDKVWSMVAISLAAQLTTLPISLFYFHQFPIYFWLSGIVVVNAATLILALGMLLFAIESIFAPLASLIGVALSWIIFIMNSLIYLIQQMPASLVTGIWISFVAMLLLYIALSGLVLSINTRKFKYLLASLGCLLIFMVQLAFTKLQQAQQKEVLIYHLRKNSAVDFFDKRHLFTLQDRAEEKSLRFAAQNYRWQKGVYSSQDIFQNEDTLETATFFYKNRFVQFYDKRFAFINQPFRSNTTSKIEVDYLVVQKNVAINIEELLQSFDCSHIILDASNKNYRIEKWIHECEQLGIQYHNIAEEGAFLISI